VTIPIAESENAELPPDLIAAPANTEQRVRQAALELFARKGFEGTGIRDIASEAGITTAALYHYMSTKENLLQVIMRDGIVPMVRAGREVIRRHSDPRLQLAGIVRVHVWVHGVRQLSARVGDTEVRSLTGPAREEIIGWRDEYQQLWLNVLAGGVACDLFRVENPKIAALALLEMCNGVSRWYSPDGQLSLEELCAYFADMALALVRVQGDYGSLLAEQLEPPSVYYMFDPGAATEGSTEVFP
jgi:AcrR family transcriptional regulator